MNQVPDFVLFLGRFHPLVVHLPIGFLFFAFILEIAAKFYKKEAFLVAVPLALLLGAVSAITACILGYLLSLSGDYEGDALDSHFWFGIATTVLAIIAWLLRTNKIKNVIPNAVKANIASLTLLVILLSVTGHYGGNLTHGSDYLTAYLPFGEKESKVASKITSVDDAVLFSHVVQPILDSKCTSCHNSSKKKGSLALDTHTAILKGGKNGVVLIAGNSSESELLRRVHLNQEDEAFMPPQGKTPLTDEEIQLIEYWIDNGQANFETKVGSIETPEEIKALLSENLKLNEAAVATSPAVSEDVLNKLQAKNLKVRELVIDSNQLDISLLSLGNKTLPEKEMTAVLEELAQIKDNIIWLSLPSNALIDDHLKIIGTFTNLKKLQLQKNTISDAGIAHLANLKNLEVLNVHSNPAITNKSLEVFEALKGIKKLYLWGTAVQTEEPSDKAAIL